MCSAGHRDTAMQVRMSLDMLPFFHCISSHRRTVAEDRGLKGFDAINCWNLASSRPYSMPQA